MIRKYTFFDGVKQILGLVALGWMLSGILLLAVAPALLLASC